MKSSLYGERDYAFGQLMLTLRTHMGLTQASLAQRLRISRRAVGTWEVGSNYPATAHLKGLIVLGVELRAFTAGREEQEIRAFWHAAHQKVLLDGRWLSDLLRPQQPSPPGTAVGRAGRAQPALDVPTFSGRQGAGDTTRSEVVLFRDQLLTTKFFIPSPSHPIIPRSRLTAL